MYKFTQEDKKWLKEHNAEKFDWYKRKERYKITINENVNIDIESELGSNLIFVALNMRYMSTMLLTDEDMLKAIQKCIDEFYRRKEVIDTNKIKLLDFSINQLSNN